MRQNKPTILLLQVFLVFVIAALCTSCESQKKINETREQFLYFQKNTGTITTAKLKERIIQPSDLISVQVLSNSLNQEQTLIFNLSTNSNNAVNNSNNPNLNPSTNSVAVPVYLVNTEGNIEMPIIGSVQAIGLTKVQLQDSLVEKISNYVKNPIVLIKFADFKVNVLGEVKLPGAINFVRDKVTIIDAISAAGDLTEYGKREDITVLREENGNKKQYIIDLRDGKLFQSPVYQLQPNDIVYVGANTRKMRSLRDRKWDPTGVQVFLGIASITTALIYLFSTISNKN